LVGGGRATGSGVHDNATRDRIDSRVARADGDIHRDRHRLGRLHGDAAGPEGALGISDGALGLVLIFGSVAAIAMMLAAPRLGGAAGRAGLPLVARRWAWR
jgi:hypothetical protein